MATIDDGNFTVARACSPIRRSNAFSPEHDSTEIIEQDWMQWFANYSRQALDTVHPSIATHFLVTESPLQDLGGGMAKWTRVYAPVPVTWEYYESFAYLFPGYAYSGTSPNYTAGREPIAQTVASRLRHEYFRLGQGGIASPDDIPPTPAQTYLLGWQDLASSTQFYLGVSTNPTQNTYKGWVTAKAYLVAEEGIIRPWKGRIYERVTRYVRAH